MRCSLDPRASLALRALLVASVLALPGCLTPPRPTDSKAEDEARDAVQLSAQLLAVADVAAAAFAEQVASIRIAGASHMLTYTAETVRNGSVAEIRMIVLSPDPADALVNLYIYANLGLWACENRRVLHPEYFDQDCDDTYGLVLEHVRTLARQWMKPDQIADLDERIEKFKSEYPERMLIGTVRLMDLTRQYADFESERDVVQPSLFTPVSEAAKQIEQARLLGDRAIWLMSRMPEAFSWRASAFLMEILASDTVTELMELVEQVSSTLKMAETGELELAAKIDRLEDRVSEGTAAVAALAASADSLARSAGELGDRITAIDARAERLEVRLSETTAGVAKLGENLAAVTGHFEGTATALHELAGANQGLGRDVLILAERFNSLQGSLEALSVEVRTLETAKSIVDETLLKAAMLAAGLIAFAGVARLVVHRFTRSPQR